MYFLLMFSCWNKIASSSRTDSPCRGVAALACEELHGHCNMQCSNISGARVRALVAGIVASSSFVVASFVGAEIEIQSSFAVGVGVVMEVLAVD